MVKNKLFLLSLLLISLLAVAISSCSSNSPDEEETDSTNSETNSGNSGDFATNSTDSTFTNAVTITYASSGATVTSNPYASSGVSISVSGGDVVVTSTTSTAVNYVLKGTSSDGMFRVNSTNAFGVVLNGVSIINNNGPALFFESTAAASVHLVGTTNNRLIDNNTYATDYDAAKATLYGAGNILLKGAGSLQVKGYSKHSIASAAGITVAQGTITISDAYKDGIHTSTYFNQTGGTLDIASTDDGIQCEDGNVQISGGKLTLASTAQDVKAINAAGTVSLTGGATSITVSGNASKGIKADGTVTLSGGTLDVTTSGGVLLESSGSGYDPSYCTAIKSDVDVLVSGAGVTITASGVANKGISVDGNLSITSGTVKITDSGSGSTYKNSSGVTDSYSAACLDADGNISITGGTITCSASGTGGKTIKADGNVVIGDASNSPTISLTTTGTKFAVSSSGSGQNASVDYCHPKTITCDGSVTINNGNITISSTDDGIHSEVALTITGGTTNITKSVEGIESKTISMEGGVVTIVASDDGVNATAGTTSGGTESDDGSYFYMKGGVLVSSATEGDAVDSNGKFLMTGGVLATYGPSNNTNEDLDVNGSLTVNGGILFGACSNSQMFEGTVSATEYGAILKASSAVSTAGSYFRIQDANGADLGTFITPRSAYYFHLFSPSVAKNTTYYVYTGGTYTGGTTTGSATSGAYCTGGTYSGGSQKKTFTTGSSYSTTVSNW